ncbi:uncharacterized protein LOC113340093 [Papaver somniferum]|uniref:uncharacterized protein LOC113340093 n=1 Tax=Papaver somniferum TaxID=3469 RepID=UPI000E6FF6ED|nr:uncharacterized protein LOC113340093 [Papaver somniferum]
MDALKDLTRKTKPNVCLIQETHMMKMNNWWVKNIWGNDQFKWKDIPSQGLSGGLLTKWDDTLFECIDEAVGPNTLSQKLKSKTEDYEWCITNVYSPCTYWESWEFWVELEDLTGWATEHWVIAGDFNAIRRRRARNKPGESRRNNRLFNEFMEVHTLIDLPLNGRLYTWSNMQPDPLLCRLDRILVFPHFENFLSNLHIWWNALSYAGTASYIMSKKLQNLKFFLKRWSRETYGQVAAKKEELTRQIDAHNKREETGALTEQQFSERAE